MLDAEVQMEGGPVKQQRPKTSFISRFKARFKRHSYGLVWG